MSVYKSLNIITTKILDTEPTRMMWLGIIERLKKLFGAKPEEVAPPPPHPPAPPTVKPPVEITNVKGIGPKRAEQLRSLGIYTAEDLTKASAEELATKTKTSSKITGKWIEEAKKLTEAS